MTKEELSELYFLRKEVEEQKERLMELEEAAKGFCIQITGMPKGTGIADNTGKFAAEIADLEDLIEINIKRCWHEILRLNAYIDSIGNSELRQILRLKHINGLTWEEIGEELGYERSTVNKKYLGHFKDSQISQPTSAMMKP